MLWECVEFSTKAQVQIARHITTDRQVNEFWKLGGGDPKTEPSDMSRLVVNLTKKHLDKHTTIALAKVSSILFLGKPTEINHKY